jgi:colanic acid biosynthesis protein WcaH
MEMRLSDKINSGFLLSTDFERAVEALPLVSVDWVILNTDGQILLGQRRNAPARHWWFTPGGRVRKNESLSRCLQRVALAELGLLAGDVHGAKLMGVWDHFYEDSAFSTEVSTHYVNLPHVLQLEHMFRLNVLPLDQHISWRWQDVHAAAVAHDVHPYVQTYAQWVIEEGIFTAPNHPESTDPPAY